jgi:hypothetical protein
MEEMHETVPDSPDEEEYEAALRAEIDDAISYDDEYLSPGRTAATLYYRGSPFGTEEAGRSKIVMPVVRDTVRATLPSLMKIFFGSTRVVEFMPSARTASNLAEDATETVNYVFTRGNPGWSICWSAFKDALVRRSGWIKWWYDESIEVSTLVFSGVSEEQLVECEQALKHEEELKVVDKTLVGQQPGEPAIDPSTGQPAPGAPVDVFEYRIHITTRKPARKVRVAAVPPDEVLLDRYARSETEARIVIHRTFETRSALVARGVPSDLIEDEGKAGAAYSSGQQSEIAARMPGQSMPVNLNMVTGLDDQDLIEHDECYWRVDHDGDGISELRKVCTIGAERKIYFDEPCDEVQLALFCPDPEPHVANGLGQSDSTMDLQLIESHVTRDVLDALKASIFPRTVFVEGQVNVDDVLNTEIGASIRARAPGMVQTLEVPFPGREAYPLLEHFQQVREQRTGIGRAAMGLDGSALQSTTPDAARQSMSASQAQVDLIARIFAETGMKRVFRGILRLLTRHQNTAMQIALNGRTLDVNPSKWDPDMEVSVNTGLGNSSTDQKIGVLAAIGEEQKAIMLQFGIDNPIVGIDNFYNVKARILELSGFRDVQKYWRDPTQSMAEGKEFPDPPPTPEEVLGRAQIKIEESKHELEALKAILLDDRERDKNEGDIMLRAVEIEAKYSTSVDMAAINAMLEKERGDRKEGQIALQSMLSNRQAPAEVYVGGAEKRRPRKVIKTPIRGPDGRIQSIHEEEIS